MRKLIPLHVRRVQVVFALHSSSLVAHSRPPFLCRPTHLSDRFYFGARSNVLSVVLAVSVQSVVRRPLSMVPWCSGLESITSQLCVSGSLVGTRCKGSIPTSFQPCSFRQYAHFSAKSLQLSWKSLHRFSIVFWPSIVLEPLSIRKFKVC